MVVGTYRIEVVPKSEGQESYSHPVQLLQAALRIMGRIDENGKIS